MFETRHDYPDRTISLFFYRCSLKGEPRPLLGQEMRWVPRLELASLGFPPADAELIDAADGIGRSLTVAAARPPAFSTATAVPGVEEVAVKIAHRDRAVARRRCRAGHGADLPVPREQLCATRGRRPFDAQRHQPLRDAAVPAVQHADDHLLADVTTLRERDRALLDARLERDRLLGHVHAEEGIASLDAGRLERGGIRRAPLQRRAARRRNALFPAGAT